MNATKDHAPAGEDLPKQFNRPDRRFARTRSPTLLSQFFGLSMFGAVMILGAGPIMAASAQPTVVELFTSQGCSSCPPANANLAELSGRPGILALSFGVTYWNRLGWADTFSKAEYTERQVAYESPLGEISAFTPQIVINGRVSTVGARAAELQRLVDDARERPLSGPSVSLTSRSVTVGAGTAPTSGTDVWLVRYDPRTVEVAVKRGENGGRTLPHKNVVHALNRLGQWGGTSVTFDIPPIAGNLKTAILVQQAQGGPILSAASD